MKELDRVGENFAECAGISSTPLYSTSTSASFPHPNFILEKPGGSLVDQLFLVCISLRLPGSVYPLSPQSMRKERNMQPQAFRKDNSACALSVFSDEVYPGLMRFPASGVKAD